MRWKAFLTTILQRQALEIPTATLFAFQICWEWCSVSWGCFSCTRLPADGGRGKVLIDHSRREKQGQHARDLTVTEPPAGVQYEVNTVLGVITYAARQNTVDSPRQGLNVFGASEIDGVVFQRIPFWPSAGNETVSRATCAVLIPRRLWRAGTAGGLATAASKYWSRAGLTSIWAISVIRGVADSG